MSTFRIPEEPFTIEGVMADLDRQLGDGSPPGPAASDSGDPAARLTALIDRATSLRRIQPAYSIRSHRRLLRYLIDPLKKLIHWGSRPYIDAAIEKQERFNEAVLEALGAIVLEALAAIDKWRGEVDAWRRGREALHDLAPFFDALTPEKRRELMDRFRGVETEIRGRQYAYVECFRGRPGHILDVGCGRGEFLEVLRMEGIESWGCDCDPRMIEIARERGVHAVQSDGHAALESVPSGSLGGVFAAQVIEHLFPGQLLSLLRLARDRIAPGGAIVLETLNPQTLGVLAKSYSCDLDHKQPIDPDYLAALLDAIGFAGTEVHRTMPFGEADRLPPIPDGAELDPAVRRVLTEAIGKLNEVIWGAQDYYVYGVVPGADPGGASPPAPAA